MGLNKRLIGAGATASGAITPSENFKAVIYDGNGGTNNITVGFKPDLVWIKQRDTAIENHNWYDSTRGVRNFIVSNSTAANVLGSTNRLNAFNSDGFTVGSDNEINDNGSTYVAWCWKANGGTTSSNTDGTVTSTVQANTKAGFSIIKYVGNGSASATVGHGLGAVPDVIILKDYSNTRNWMVYVSSAPAANQPFGGNLDLSNAFNTSAGTNGGHGTPTSSVLTFTNGSSSVDNVNANNANIIAYCFKSIDGFSSFGSYTGNSSDNGPIVETGFEPAFIMAKQTDDTSNWVIVDNKRSTTNPRDKGLRPNTYDTEATVSNNMVVDFLSNGFQLKQTSGANANNGTFIYMAFAADPDTEAPTLADSFNIKTYTGNDGTQDIDVGFQPGLVWLKNRNNSSDSTFDHSLFDNLRGTFRVRSNSNGAENDYASHYGGINDNGFQVKNGLALNDADGTYVAWAFKADDNEPTIFGGPALAVYKFEDNANDVGGSYNGTANNITYATGNFNKAAVFNGSSSGVDIGNLGIGGAAARTISAWVYVDSLSSAQTIFQYGSNSNGQRFGFAIDTAGKVYVEFYNRDAITSSAHISINTWYHLVVTYNGGAIQTTENTQIYVNGVAVAMSNSGAQTGNANTGDSNYGIGYDRLNTRQYFDGKIDQVRIYRGALGQDEISELYAETVSDNDNLSLGGLPEILISANANAGFSIVKYNGSGVSGTKIPHGLSAAPNLILIKCISDGSTNWIVHHSSLGNSKYLTLNDNSVQDTSTNWLVPSATTFALNQTFGNANTSGRQYIAYCWHSVSGYSAFGSYAGNGTSQSINIGFKPDLLILRKYDDNQDWMIWDSVRDGNPKEARLEANNSDAEVSGTTNINFISTGFEFTSGFYNDSGQNSIYMAFKMNPTPMPLAGNMSFLVVAGGGAGGTYYGAGGGAGGLRTSYGDTSGGGSSAESDITLAAGTYTITIGAGGTGTGTNGGSSTSRSGADSSIAAASITTITSTGGGGGATGGSPSSLTGAAGGSGGGTWTTQGSGGAGTTGQGYAGGTGTNLGGYSEVNGGGGGASAVGQTGTSAVGAGDGGAGLAVSITGASVAYAGGGGAGGPEAGAGDGTYGVGGTGGGGNGGYSTAGQENGTSGTANTGGGGGGGSAGILAGSVGTIGTGGSGVVVLRLKTAEYSGTTTGSPTVTTDGDFTIIKYTGSGTYVHS